MANTLLTPTAVTREALRILHQKLNFIGTINRQYDKSFAKDGAKIGSSLKIRLPNEYTVRSGRVLSTQATTESSVTLTVGTQKGVDVSFTSDELTLSLDDFSSRILKPAMSVLAANIESDAMSMYKDIYNEISDVGAAATVALVLKNSKRLTDFLAPSSDRCLNLGTTESADLIAALAGQYNPTGQLSEQFREGMVQNQFLGFQKVYENTLWPIHTTGTDDGTGDYLINGAGQSGATLTIDTGAGTWKKGDIFNIDSVFSVHPETKASTGTLKQFVVTADAGVSATSLSISPAIVTSGATQNVNAGPGDDAKLNKQESDASTAVAASADYQISMGYHKDAFAFVTADLEMPSGVDFASRQVLDGVSMRIVRDYDINNDAFPCRIDVLYGYKTIRAPLACRLGLN